jgi:hypothetical protein
MNDTESSRLALLRFLERVQERDLSRTRRRIAERNAARQNAASAKPGARRHLSG